MRKILGNPALEAELKAHAEAEQAAALEAAHVAALENISLEEQSLLIDEANQAADEAGADLAEVDRVTEVSDALEDLALIAGDIKDPTEGEVALMGNAAQMAVAGTDVPPEEVVPALESVDDFKKSATDFAARVKAKAREIWEKIMAFLEKIWGQIKEFFYRVFDTIPSLQKKLNGQLKQLQVAKTQGHNTAGGKVRLNAGLGALQMEGGAALDADNLKAGFHSLNTYCDYVFGKYADSVKSRGDAIAKEIEKFTWDTALTSADAIAGAAMHHKLAAPSTTMRSAGTQGEYAVSFTKGTLGGLAFTHKVATDAALTQANSLRRLELLRGEVVEATRANNGSYGGSAYEVDALSSDSAGELVKEALEVLKKLDGWKKSGLKKLEESQNSLKKASGKATGLLSAINAAKDEKLPKDIDIALYRGALNFNTAFTKWTSEPAVALTRSAIASVRALSLVVDKSLAAYGPQGQLANGGAAA